MPFSWRCRRKYFNWSCFNLGQTGYLWSEEKSTNNVGNMGEKGNNMDVRDACASCQVNFISLSLLYLLTKVCVEKKDFLSLLSEPYLHIYMRGLSGQEMNIAPNARLINLKGIWSSFLHLTFGTFLFRNSFYFQL